MALTVQFGGGSLPAGWTFAQNQAANATIDNSGDDAAVAIAAGTTSDSIFSTGSADNTAGLVHAVSGDFDIAARFSTPLGGDNSGMVGFIIRGATDADMVRWTYYAQSDQTWKYGYARDGGGGSNFDTNGITNAGWWLNGHPSWMRAKNAGGQFTFYASADGVTWQQMAQTAVTSVAPETIKLCVGQIGADLGLPVRWDEVVDLGALGGTDARGDALPTLYQDTIESTDFTTLPSWLTLTSAVDGSSVHSTGKVTIATAAADGSRGAITYNGAGYARNAGMLVSYTVPSPDVQCYLIIGLAVDDGGAQIDVYSDTPGYVDEIQIGTTNEHVMVQAHRPYSGGARTVHDEPAYLRSGVQPRSIDAFNEPYAFLDGDQRWTEGNQASTRFVRIERYGKWLRMRQWSSVTPGGEPTTWNWEGVEDALRGEGPLKPFICIAHNPGSGGAATVEVESLDFYALTDVAPNPRVTDLSLGGVVPDELYVGATPVQEVYLGSTKVWEPL